MMLVAKIAVIAAFFEVREMIWRVDEDTVIE
jgi:hypothetical protein